MSAHRIGISLVLFLALTASVARSQTALPAEAYTGTLHNDQTGSDQVVRLAIVKVLDAAATREQEIPVYDYRAFLTLFRDGFNGPEHVALFYSEPHYNWQTGELLLQQEVTDSQKLPRIFLTRTEAGGLGGDFFSPTAGRVGSLRLQRGWTVPSDVPEELVTSLGGTYVGFCPSFDSSRLMLEAIEIAPTRFPYGGAVREAALEAVQYVGGAICGNVWGDTVACGGLGGGVYDFYRERFLIWQGSWNWDCRREAEGLTCTNPRYRDCFLEKEPADALDEAPRWSMAEPAPMPDGAEPNPGPARWAGKYAGVLDHAVTGRQQYVELDLSLDRIGGPEPAPQFALAGEARQYFGDEPSEDERNNFVFTHREILPSYREQILLPDEDKDAILVIVLTREGNLQGRWYSKLYGFVGTFELARYEGARPSYPRLERPIPSPRGWDPLESTCRHASLSIL